MSVLPRIVLWGMGAYVMFSYAVYISKSYEIAMQMAQANMLCQHEFVKNLNRNGNTPSCK